MVGKFQRRVGRVTSILGIALLIPTVAWLVSQGAGALTFLPQRHSDFFVETGSIRLALSTTHLGYLILIISILLIARGQFISRRERLNHLRS
jgi:hypothetical protein